MSPEDIEKYSKLLRITLDPDGNENEQNAARKVLRRMKAQYPDIHDAAVRLIAADYGPAPGSSPGAGPGAGPEFNPGPGGRRAWGGSGMPPSPPPEAPQGAAAQEMPLWSRVLGHPLTGLLLSGSKQYAELFADYLEGVVPVGTWTPIETILEALDGYGPVQYPFVIAQAYALARSGRIQARQTPTGLELRRNS